MIVPTRSPCIDYLYCAVPDVACSYNFGATVLVWGSLDPIRMWQYPHDITPTVQDIIPSTAVHN